MSEPWLAGKPHPLRRPDGTVEPPPITPGYTREDRERKERERLEEIHDDPR